MSAGKWLLIGVVGVLVVLFFQFDLGQYLTLDYLKSQKDQFTAYYESNMWLTMAAFMGLYIVVTGLSLPGATIFTLAGGALFGFGPGFIAVSFASTIGATCAFLAARFVLKDWVQSKFSKYLAPINEGMAKEGAFYLFTMRLIPVFPFFVVNLLMGLTPISASRFFVVSQIGMLPGTAVYVNAGTQLGKIDSLQGILSPQLLLSFALLGIFPIVAKKIIEKVKDQSSSTKS